MNKNSYKSLLAILIIVLILIIITLINQNLIKNNYSFNYSVYSNELSKKIENNDLADVDYNFLSKDLNEIDEILKDELSLDVDRIKKTEYYKKAEEIYTNKINEYIRVLNDKLDNEDFYRLELDLEDFQKNIDFAITDFENTLESSIDFEFYKNRYLYEEKQKKCRDILELYKGFLQ